MDRNTRTRIISTVGIVALVGVLIFAGFRMFSGARARFSDWFDTGEEISENSRMEPTSAEVALLDSGELRDFQRIAATGGWKIVVRPGEFSVTVRVSEGAADDVDVYEQNDTLHLTVAPGLRSVTGNLTAEISMPSLDRIEIDGGADVQLHGLELEQLSIEVDGAASVKAYDGRIDRLEVDVDGATSLDFSRSRIVDARIDMDGASNLNVNMAGGTLTGVLRGVGNVRYTGTVSEESVRIEGLGRVKAE